MKKYLFIIAAACVALVSCNKNETPVETPSGASPIKITLTAAIGSDTKVTYTDEGNVLKTAWELGDKVSLLALDDQKRLISNDIFIAQSSGNTVDFSGTFTNHEDTREVYVYYPALTEGEGTVEDPFMTEPAPGGQTGILYEVSLREHDTNPSMPESLFSHILNGYYLQTNDADPSHLARYAIMKGLAVMNGNKFNVTLDHMSFIVKGVFTLPSEGYKVKKLTLRSYDKEDQSVNISATSWQYIYANPANHNLDSNLQMSFGESISNDTTGECTGLTLGGDTMTVYFVGFGEKEMSEGNYWDISLDAYLSEEYSPLIGKKTFTSAKTLEPGNMYRLNLDLEQNL